MTRTTMASLKAAAERARAMPLYDRGGRRILRRSEWERLSRRRRWRDILMGWDPPPERRFPWDDD
ncbi:MAG TPA: hypothetical protein VFU94_03035 [Conexibacter sp.]|nr:hypothetical protein [Conexibacter sp.]